MTVSELIVWLQTQDQGATVEVLMSRRSSGYDGGDDVCTVDFSPELSEYSDMRGNQFVKPDASYFNKRTLLLGDRE